MHQNKHVSEIINALIVLYARILYIKIITVERIGIKTWTLVKTE